MSEKKKILVVDDEAQIIRVLRRILDAHDYSVRTAEDGESAWLCSGWHPTCGDVSQSDVNVLETQSTGPIPIFR